ncbi:MAG: rod shape-determining protein MreD [Acidimicrobiales bacterium]
MTPRNAARLRIGAVLLTGIVVQTTLAPDLRLAGVAPDLMLLLAICGGLAGGAGGGAVTGFAAGLLADLWLTDTPVGLSALTWCIVGFAVGTLRSNVLPESRWLATVMAAGATVAGVLAFVVLGDVVGQSQLLIGGRSWLLRVVVLEAAWAAVLSWPVSRLFEWAARGSDGAAELGRGRPDRLAVR